MKFKKGDNVRVRQWEDMELQYGRTSLGNIACKATFTTEMRECCGKIFMVTDSDWYYSLGGIGWSWSDDMLDSVDVEKEDTLIHIDYKKQEKQLYMKYANDKTGVVITIKELIKQGACAEGMMWFIKEYGVIASYEKGVSLELVYQDLKDHPDESWLRWLKNVYSIVEYELCCKAFKDHYGSASGYLYFKHNKADGWLVTSGSPDMHYGLCMSYCPFCGKRLKPERT